MDVSSPFMRTLSWQQVYARRLAASRLDERAPHDELLEVARATLGAHAQLMTGAELALSARVDGVTRDEVRELLWERRALVKGNTIRGTLHLHPADDFALWKSLGADALARAEVARLAGADARGRGVPAGGGARRARRAADARGDRRRDRRDVRRPHRDRLVGPPARPGGRRALPRPAARPQGHVRPLRPLDRRAGSCATATTRSASSCAATSRRTAPCAATSSSTGSRSSCLRMRSTTWRRSTSRACARTCFPGTAFPDAEPAGVRLLSHYDVYVIACHPRAHLIPEQKERIFLRGAGPNPALLVDGRVAGVWSRTLRGQAHGDPTSSRSGG